MKIQLTILCAALLCILFTEFSKNHHNREQNMMRFSLNGSLVACDKKLNAPYNSTSGPDANITFYARWGDNEPDFRLSTYTTDITPGKYEHGPDKAYAVAIWSQGTVLSPGIHYNCTNILTYKKQRK